MESTMATEDPDNITINAEPTKAFFVDMLTRDIPLEQAVLDLVDNCVDGAKRVALALQNGDANEPVHDGRWVKIDFDKDTFRIHDNCGGFDRSTAATYAFRFGRPRNARGTAHSIGQFGVGMKRALFKFGRHFAVQSATTEECWAISVDVSAWEQTEGDWTFPWSTIDTSSPISTEQPGTDIRVTQLRQEVSNRFSSPNFFNAIIALIKSKHRQFIAEGLAIFVNGSRVNATDIRLLMSDKLVPGVDALEFTEGGDLVTAKIIVGVGQSSPREAGWYVVCNGRVVLEADRRATTGWGLVEDAAGRTVIPTFHNQFARFRGFVFFDSEDSARVPWNTTKTDVDQDSIVWVKTFARMLEMMRPVIDFLNELDQDIDEHSRENSPLLDHVSKANMAIPESFTKAAPRKTEFLAPARGSLTKGPKFVKIQFSRPAQDIEFLQDALGVSSAKAVGETCFDLELERQR